MMASASRRKGFTLIEILSVVVIVGILAAVLLPFFNGLIARGESASCANNMRQIYTAFMTYRSDNNGYLPPGNLIPPSESNGGNGTYNWKAALSPAYLSEIPVCPSVRLSAKGKEFHRDSKAYLQSLGSYSVNAYLLGIKIEAVPGPYWGNYPYCGDSRFLFLAETYMGGGATWSTSQLDTTLDGADWGSAVNVMPRNHGKNTLNYCFLDGHIEQLKPPLKADGKTRDWGQLFQFGYFNKGTNYVGPFINVSTSTP